MIMRKNFFTEQGTDHSLEQVMESPSLKVLRTAWVQSCAMRSGMTA